VFFNSFSHFLLPPSFLSTAPPVATSAVLTLLPSTFHAPSNWLAATAPPYKSLQEIVLFYYP